MKPMILALYRVRIPLYVVAAVALIGNLLLGKLMLFSQVRVARLIAVCAAILLGAACLLAGFLAPRWLPTPSTRVVLSPVTGRWLGLNSPASQIAAGIRIGSCGNSGNSSEPHVHAQLADRASLWTAQGIPLAFADITLDDGGVGVDALPKSGQHMFVSERAGEQLP